MTTGLLFKTSFASMGSLTMQAKPSTATTQVLGTVSSGGGLFSVSSTPIVAATTLFKSPTTKASTLPIFPIIPAFKDPYAISRPVDTRLQDKEPGPDVKYSPYEELTGISKVRPEILLVTNFQPIFDSASRAAADKGGAKDSATPGLNPIGEFLDAQVQLQHLRHEAMVKLVNDMKDADPDVEAALTQKENDFKFHISNLTTNVNFLYDTVKRLDRVKSAIDIKNSSGFTFETMMYRYFSTLQSKSVQKQFDITAMNNLTFQSVLSDRGFDPKNVQAFTSTKTFLQTLFEIKSLLKGNSYNLLGINPQAQRADQDPVYINKHTPQGFVFSPDKIETIKYNDLLATTKDGALSYVNSIKAAYDALFSTTNFQSAESRIAFLSSWYSHEFSFSRSLASETTKTFIRNTFGYSISDALNNSQMFDVALGDIGDKIIDRTDSFSANSISTIANKVVNNVSVLPFEPDYIEFEKGVHTPGSSYFVDSALQVTDQGFNVSNMQSFSSELDAVIKRFTELSKQMNFIPTYKRELGESSGYLGDQFQNSRLLFEYALYSFVDRATGAARSSVLASDLPGVFNVAQKDNYLKSLLFLYVLLKSFGTTSSTGSQALENIVEEIDSRINGRLGTIAPLQINTLTQVLRSYTLGGPSQTHPVSAPRESISNELKELRSTSEFLRSVINLFKGFYDSFISSNGLTDVGFTRYSHVQNVILMMISFDLIVNVVATYVPKQFDGQYSTKSSSAIGKTWYSVSSKISASTFGLGRTAASGELSTVILRNPVSISTVNAKLDAEVNSLVKMSFMVISSLTNMKDILDSTLKVMASPSSTSQLNTILGIIGDKRLFSLAMTQQQILLIKAMLDDINDKIAADKALAKGAGNIDFELRGAGRDDIALLDDAVVPIALKNVLLALLANEKFSSVKGRNIRVLTIGVPSGMADRLKQKVLLDKIDRNTFSQKQVDIIRVNIYKVDVENQDIVFKPQSFLFELSRFVPHSGGVKSVPAGATISQILDALPTRDYSSASSSAKKLADGKRDQNIDSSEYDFLTADQKKEMLHNHAMSYVFETYIRLLTGVSASEYDLVVDPSQLPKVSASKFFVDAAADHVISKAVKSSVKDRDLASLKSFQQATNSAPSAKLNVEAQARFAPSAGEASQKMQEAVATSLAAASSVVETAKRAKTVYSDNTSESRRLFTPKLFDRVFSIPVDPDDFEIDFTETLKTASGKESFDKLLKQGFVEQVSDQSTFFASALATPKYRLKERDINENDLTFEKYFVTFDTVFDEVV